ncbi:MAG: hypothetical protein ACYDAK_05325 [Candidatus Limnocylindrales bacterium]
MAVIEAVRVVGVAPIMRMLEQFEGQPLQNAMRRAVRAGAKPFQATLKSVAASSSVPRSFQKVPAPKVTTHGGSGRSIEAYVRPKSPLFNIFEPGAGVHTISPGSAGVLGGPAGPGGWSTAGRKRPGDFFSRGPVSHPGMRARPILPAAFAMGEPASVDAMANAIFQITGSTP